MSASRPLRLSAAQGRFLTLGHKFKAFVGGFGSGKTYVGATDACIFAGRHPGLVQGYFAPTYRDIRDTYWPTLEEAGHALGFVTRVRATDKEVTLTRAGCYYGTVICRSMDSPGSIVGFKIARGHIDEIDVMPTHKAAAAWNKIIARLRLVVPDVVNGMIVTTTPEGFKWTYETFKRNPRPGYGMVQASTHENADHLPPDYIESLRTTYADELIEAYLQGEFVNLTSGTVYRSYLREACRSAETIRPGEPLHIGQDFNVGNMVSVINVHRPEGIGPGKAQRGYHVVGELVGVLDTPTLIGVLQERFPKRRIHIYPDASGGSRHSSNASTSDLALLRQAGFIVRVPSYNPAVKDRVLSVNTAYTQGLLWVNDTAAPRFAEAQEKQAYDPNGEPDKSTGFDHPNDAQGYFVHFTMPVLKPTFTARELRI